MAATAFGQLFKKLRTESGQSLREFCLRCGYDPGNISRLERGRIAPPKSQEKLAEYGLALGLTRESERMREFVDTGLTCAGQIPPDVMANDELVAKLPILLRTANTKLTREQLDDFIEMIKGS
jgi:transcriptional regulator with XRE-family HTH domain